MTRSRSAFGVKPVQINRENSATNGPTRRAEDRKPVWIPAPALSSDCHWRLRFPAELKPHGMATDLRSTVVHHTWAFIGVFHQAFTEKPELGGPASLANFRVGELGHAIMKPDLADGVDSKA